MSTQGNGKPTVYRVSLLGPVKNSLRSHYQQAKMDGAGNKYLIALHHIYQRLRLDPHSFGEPRFRLAAMKMVVHVAIHPPLAIVFGIHEAELLVVVRDVHYLK